MTIEIDIISRSPSTIVGDMLYDSIKPTPAFRSRD